MQQTDLGLNLSTNRTRKRESLSQMDRVMPWGDLVAVVSPEVDQPWQLGDALLLRLGSHGVSVVAG
jgi:hypothetical protein